MLDALAYDFVRNAILAGALAALLCGVLGTLVVVKRLVFISGGLSHAAFGGLGLCYYLGIEPLLGAAAVAVAMAVMVSGEAAGGRRAPDALIGVLWAVGMAVGAVFIHLAPGYSPDLGSYLFGSILTISPDDVLWTAILTAIVLVVFVVLHKEIVAVVFDDDFAAVQGAPVRRLMLLLMVLVALSIVLLIRLVGILLVIALLTIPPLVALRLVKSLVQVVVVASLVGLAMTLGGLALAYRLDLPSGPAIVLLGALLLLVVRGVGAVAQARRRSGGREEDPVAGTAGSTP